MATGTNLSPLEQERAEFGYEIQDIRDRQLRIIKRSQTNAIENDSDTCIFFVHGGGGRGCQFKNQIRSLQKLADVVAVDFLGHGDSPAPNNPLMYTADEHLRDLNEVFQRYKKGRNFIFAHCYGALHTLRLLKLLSDKEMLYEISGVALLALGKRNPVSASWIKYVPSTILEWLRPIARSSSNATLFTPETDPNLIAFENAVSDNNRMYVMKVVGLDCSDSARWETWLQEGKEVVVREKIPVVIIAGEGDGVFPPDTCQSLSQFFELPDSSFHVIPGVGHLAMLEKPDAVTSILREFITQTGSR